MEIFIFLQYFIGGALRFWLINSEHRKTIANRVEISTPVNSWKRITEGVFLFNNGVDPYEGDMFHETPIGLIAYKFLLHHFGAWINIIFIISDLVTAYLLYQTACQFMASLHEKESKERSKYAKDIEVLLVTEENIALSPIYVAAAYLFNPYVIFNCVGQTTTVFSNLCLALIFYFMIKGRRMLSCTFLALVTFQSLYTFVLIVPICIYVAEKETSGKESNLEQLRKQSIIYSVLYFIFVVTCLFLSSYFLTGKWSYLNSTFGFILNVPDLRPNVGLFWYFFTEMFEHFRLLFICAFQINVLILYLVPLTFRLRKEPMLLAVSLTTLIAIFKSYPCLGDVGFYLALLPMWKHLFNYMQQGFIVGCFFVITSVLGPIVWHLWIYARSANANFYFGVTLAFATAQIFLLTDILFAYIKREFSLQHGLRREVDGKPAKLVLE